MCLSSIADDDVVEDVGDEPWLLSIQGLRRTRPELINTAATNHWPPESPGHGLGMKVKIVRFH